MKYISDSFIRAYDEISKIEDAHSEDRDEYLALNVSCVPQEARWENIKNNTKDPTIGQVIDMNTLKISLTNVYRFIEKAKKRTDLTELTPKILHLFIDKIEVDEKAEKYSRAAPQDI